MPTLETERLVLRMFRPEDADAYASMCADPEVMRFLAFDGKPMSRLEAWRSLAMMVGHWHLRGYGMWALEERTSGTLVGRVGFNDPDGWPGFEIGWMLGRAWWGRGYASEGARAALAHAFSALDREHVISIILPDNHRSIRVAEGLGERVERTIDWFGKPALVYGIQRDA